MQLVLQSQEISLGKATWILYPLYLREHALEVPHSQLQRPPQRRASPSIVPITTRQKNAQRPILGMSHAHGAKLQPRPTMLSSPFAMAVPRRSSDVCVAA